MLIAFFGALASQQIKDLQEAARLLRLELQPFRAKNGPTRAAISLAFSNFEYSIGGKWADE
jgi:hypothetical protein